MTTDIDRPILEPPGGNKKVLLASLDTRRPAAMEQLRVLGTQIGVDTLPIVATETPVQIARRALGEARLGGYDVLMLDTAGRTHIDEELMAETAEIKAVTNPHEILLVADALTGQDAVNLARSFDARVDITGLVLTRGAEPGQIVNQTSGALFRMAKDGEMELDALLSESDLARLSVGVPAQVTPVGSSKSYEGHVWEIEPIIDPQTRQGIAKIAIPYHQDLRPGGFAAATIQAGAAQAPLLPQSAVLSDDKGNYVYVVGAGDKVERRDVTTGVVSDKGVAIASGLNGTEHVVVTAGASAALLLACCALVGTGDRVLMSDPSYPCNRHFVAAFDGMPVCVPVGASTRFQLTAPLVREHWQPGTRGVLLASPANPTGTSVPSVGDVMVAVGGLVSGTGWATVTATGADEPTLLAASDANVCRVWLPTGSIAVDGSVDSPHA